ncbi:MAG: ferredoxin III, nif-specific [Desulfuromonadales bacterium GWD2_61_12]|nr:MAG: ferredoxin III, nif-specific [Desulfuromonadales bacterium GWC2_61_20]OGR36120.1 MAG: ferredoxin III, nif-specific [Desulfuromonadales bacterium GWD2_61_12]HAD04888.1 ferredoxin III, nif-specific [Desulfuromonas sp.]HBT83647.1 ferredoxin III, nif-specific [Desulfuromonas sp.]
MAFLTGKTRGGKEWTPTFAMAIDHEKCIGCGRCYKACSRSVLGPEDLVDEESDSTRMVMAIVNADNCIGCAGCGVTCPKKAFSFKPLTI